MTAGHMKPVGETESFSTQTWAKSVYVSKFDGCENVDGC